MRNLITKYYNKIFIPLLEDTNNINTALYIMKIACICSLVNKDNNVDGIIEKIKKIMERKDNKEMLIKN